MQERPRGTTPRPRSGAVTRGVTPHPRSGAWPGGATPPPHAPTPEAKGGGREEQPNFQGAVSTRAQEGLEELSHVEGQEGGSEEIPLIQGKEQWLHFAGAAVKRYPTPKRARPNFPHSQSLPPRSFHKPLIHIHQRTDRIKPQSQKTNQTDHMDHSLV